MIEYRLDHVVTFTASLVVPPEVIGPVPEGIRANFYCTGGSFAGPRLRGKIHSVGGDWLTLRRNGVAELDVRATFETHDGALILVRYGGKTDTGEEGYESFLKGNIPASTRLMISPQFSTSHADYLWLNRLFCVGIGEFSAATGNVTYDVYALH